MSTDEFEPGSYHPLFPAMSDDRDPPRVETIHVQRTPDGTHHHAFGADELQSLEQLYQMFGGGQYTLLARAGGRLTGRQTVTLPGRSKPLNPELPAEEDDEPEAPPPMYQAPSGAPSDSLMIAMLQMMQQNSQQQTQMMLAQSQQTIQLVTALMAQSGQGAQSHVATMQALHDRFAQSQSDLMKAMLESKTATASSGGGLDAFMKGVEFADRFAGASEEDGIAGIVDSLSPFLQGANAAVGGKDE